MLWHLETSGRIMGILSPGFDNVELQCNANMYVVGLHFARKDSYVGILRKIDRCDPMRGRTKQ